MEEIAQPPTEASGLGLEPAMPLDVTNETPSAARMQLYQTQSCLFITTRILVVDFLVHRLQPSQVGYMKTSLRHALSAYSFCLATLLHHNPPCQPPLQPADAVCWPLQPCTDLLLGSRNVRLA